MDTRRSIVPLRLDGFAMRLGHVDAEKWRGYYDKGLWQRWAVRSLRPFPTAQSDIDAISRSLHQSYRESDLIFVGIGRSPHAFLLGLKTVWKRKVAKIAFSFNRNKAAGDQSGSALQQIAPQAIAGVMESFHRLAGHEQAVDWVLLDYVRTGKTMDVILEALELWTSGRPDLADRVQLVLLARDVASLCATRSWANEERVRWIDLNQYPLLDKHLFCESFDHPIWVQAWSESCLEN
jgi:hypothetical protein